MSKTVCSAKLVLCATVPLFGGPCQPVNGFCFIMGQPKTLLVGEANMVSGIDIAFFDCFAKPCHGFCIVLGNAFTVIIGYA